MAAIKRVLANWWVLAVGAALLVTLVVFLVCGVLIGSALFLRWWLILVVWLIFAGLAAWHVVKARRASAAIAKAMEPADTEAEVVGDKMKAALAKVKASGKDALYTLPWYVIIGPPGAGKTTIIQKSGLRLISDEAAAGVGGTRNCDWWFTDEAVLIDTAGRYTSQDSQGARDAKGWENFLATLKKARPLQPLNGVIVAIGLDEIGTASADALDRHVVAIRARLSELSRQLGLELPVYVLFTKADLVAGFVEFFDDLTVEGRRSVLGHTLPLGEHADEAELTAGFDAVAQALADRVPRRLQTETDTVRRGAALNFPARIIELRARAVRLLDGIFGGGTAPGKLRGFYLTSGVQQGTPFDRLLGGMAATLGRSVRAKPSTPRAFFVNRLLKDVMIAEAGLAGGDAGRQGRERRAQTAAFAAIGVIAVLLLGAWIWSLFANMGGQRATALAATQIAESTRALDAGDRVSTSAGTAEVLDLLDSLRDKLPYGVTNAASPPLGERFGLYRGNLADESARAYNDALQRYLLPRVIVTTERALAAAGSDPIAAYDPLKIYLMLGNRAGAARDPRYILGWLERELEARDLPGEENAAQRKRVLRHAEALLGDTGRFGRQLTGPVLDGALVQSAQATVAAMSPAQRALALMRQQVQGEDWTMVGGALLPGEADAFGNPQEVAAAKVPYLFTKTGFQKGFVPQVATIGAELDKDRWMLGGSIEAQAPLDMAELGRLYAADYVKAWNAMLALPQPSDYARNPTALARLANTSASPLKKITDQVLANTAGLSPKGLKAPKGPKLPGGALGKAAGGAIRGAVAERSGASASILAAGEIEGAFAGLRGYAAGPTAPMNQLLEALGKYQLALAAASVGGGGGAPGAPGGGASGQIAAAAAELSVAAQNAGATVPQLGTFVSQVAGGSSKQSETQKTSELRDAYAKTVAATCTQVMGAGYPFGTGADLQPADVSRVAGIVDGFGRDQLGTYVDRSAAAWAWIKEPTVASFAPASARAFQRASEVQAMMGGNLVLRISAAPTNKTAIRLRVAGVPMDLAPAAPPERMSWSTGGSQVAELIATGDAATPPLREEGPWALFRLLGKGGKAATGPGQYRFTFSPATAIDVGVAGGPDPFAADGPFSLRCPAQL
ncbi:type VI secretion system membrane subunit TssM [Sphingomonas sp.]|uniref:type VI secretion system membrane subunit TssM n=1 Tax=Sphingomonas sp. TaxID=28214 RepID=UPI0035BBCC6B